MFILTHFNIYFILLLLYFAQTKFNAFGIDELSNSKIGSLNRCLMKIAHNGNVSTDIVVFLLCSILYFWDIDLKT